MSAQQPEPFVAIEDVAKFFSVSISTIRSWIRRGYIPPTAYLYIGNTYRFRITDVVAALTATQDEPEEVEAVEETVTITPTDHEDDMEQLSFDFESATADDDI